MNRLDAFKEAYFKEIERRTDLNNEISIPIGFATLLGTGLFFYITSYDFNKVGLATWLFICLCLGTLFFLMRGIFFLLRSYNVVFNNIEYDYIAFPETIENYYQQMLVYFRSTGAVNSEAVRLADEDLKDYYLAAFVRTSTNNAKLNDDRQEYLWLCKRAMLYSLGCLLCGFIPYIFENYRKEDNNIKIEFSRPLAAQTDSIVLKQLNLYPKTQSHEQKKQRPNDTAKRQSIRSDDSSADSSR